MVCVDLSTNPECSTLKAKFRKDDKTLYNF